MSLRLRIQDAWQYALGEHFFSTLARQKRFVARLMVRANYSRRIRREYPIARCRDGRELLFIHIPKNAGTSVARALGFPQVRHLPAIALAMSDPDRFSSAIRFAIIREPLDRLTSLMRHLCGAPLAARDDIIKAESMGLTDADMGECIGRFITERGFRRRLFRGTTAGRSGLSVMQTDYVAYRGQLLVPNLFDFSRIDLAEKWLQEVVDPSLRLPHINKTEGARTLFVSAKNQEQARRVFSRDYALYESIAIAHVGMISSSQ